MDITTFSALAEPNRFRIVEILLEGPLTVGEIADRLQLRQPQTSKHLHVLLESGLVEQGNFYGFESWGKALYQEIVEPEKVVFIDYFSDAEGNEVEGMPSSHITMTLVEHEGKTKIISRAQYASEEDLKTVMEMGMEQGITQTWDRLEEHLQSIQ
jgi:DNA-binding transcriptional ArsR family regulator